MPREQPRCPRCGRPLREEHFHYRCEVCGIVEMCCEGEMAQPEFIERKPPRRKKSELEPPRAPAAHR
jgi:hypothetical protein